MAPVVTLLRVYIYLHTYIYIEPHMSHSLNSLKGGVIERRLFKRVKGLGSEILRGG